MATATKNLVPPVNPDYALTLVLDQQEARVLLGILNKIGGMQHDSWRGIASQISSAIQDAGVEPAELPCTSSASTLYADGPAEF